MKELTKAEEQIMQVLWRIEKGFANEIMANLPEPKPAYNTALTIVRILEKKGFVGYETFGKANRYYPLINKEAYSNSLIKGLVKNYFNNSFKSMVSCFADNQNITSQELEEIRAIIDKGKNKNKE